MENGNGQRRYVQISRADSRGVLLDITDMDFYAPLYDRAAERRKKREGQDFERAPRVQLTLVKYDPKKPAGERGNDTSHWLEEPVMMVLMQDILNGRKGALRDLPAQDGKPARRFYEPILDDFRGGHDRDAGCLVSRRLTVRYNDGLDMGPVYEFTFTKCEGVEGANGAVEPKKGGRVFYEPTTIRIQLGKAGRNDFARRLAMEVLEYLRAKKAAVMVSEWSGEAPAPRAPAPAPRRENPTSARSYESYDDEEAVQGAMQDEDAALPPPPPAPRSAAPAPARTEAPQEAPTPPPAARPAARTEAPPPSAPSRPPASTKPVDPFLKGLEAPPEPRRRTPANV